MRVAVYTQIEPAEPESVHHKGISSITTATSDGEIQGVEYIDMANGWAVATLGWLIWGLITGLNIYLIVMLVLGKS